MSNYIAKDTNRYIIQPLLRQIHKPHNYGFQFASVIVLGLVGFALLNLL